MNYPVREAILNFVMGKTSASTFVRLIHHQEEVYPAQFRYALMNLVGSHDRCRALNILAGRECQELSKADQQHVHLNVEEYELAVRRYKLCIDLLCALPGCATVYYGDEVGLTGCHDPWNRRACTKRYNCITIAPLGLIAKSGGAFRYSIPAGRTVVRPVGSCHTS